MVALWESGPVSVAASVRIQAVVARAEASSRMAVEMSSAIPIRSRGGAATGAVVRAVGAAPEVVGLVCFWAVARRVLARRLAAACSRVRAGRVPVTRGVVEGPVLVTP